MSVAPADRSPARQASKSVRSSIARRVPPGGGHPSTHRPEATVDDRSAARALRRLAAPTDPRNPGLVDRLHGSRSMRFARRARCLGRARAAILALLLPLGTTRAFAQE